MIRNLCIISLFFARMLIVYGLLSFVSLVSLRCLPNMWWSCWRVGKKVLVVTSQPLFGGHSSVLVVDYWEQAELLNLWGGWTFSSEIKRVFLAFLMWWRVAMSGLWVSSFEEFLDVCSFLLIFHVHFLCTWGLSRNLGFFFNKTLTIKKIKKLQREGLHS